MTRLQMFLDYSEERVKDAFKHAKAVLFCGCDECMGYNCAYYMVVCGFGVCYKVTATEQDTTDPLKFDLSIEKM